MRTFTRPFLDKGNGGLDALNSSCLEDEGSCPQSRFVLSSPTRRRTLHYPQTKSPFFNKLPLPLPRVSSSPESWLSCTLGAEWKRARANGSGEISDGTRGKKEAKRREDDGP